MTYTRVVRLTDADEVADVVARRFLDSIVALQRAQGMVHVCLTGGNTANLMYERFAELAPESGLDSGLLQLWWSDERFIPATDPDRNSLQALTRLARTVDIKSASTHMMPAADGRLDAHQCAAEYAAELGDTHFDIALLGVGADGHIGSIFPNHQSFEATTKTVIGVTEAPKAPAERITLTIPALNRTDQLWFIVNGTGKADAVARAVRDDRSLPAAHPKGRQSTFWFIDEEAAADLPEPYRCEF
ncbi:6-phosphogluconolactonase [Tessaracoccus sp. OS52]|uniref:6-phosphogluconolactonase n=1 Tax=Tessaracoccus sp. OS52 TaxID=2886691 RepID=UPI001D10B63F|nr:6-phosphogluconolactonase [Tessaracoccus sp. OS52]